MPTCYRHAGRETYIRCQRCERPICPDCMRDAAVGFHCPGCIAEGAKQTRQHRLPYGGTRSANPAATSIGLIVANVAVWLAMLASGGQRGWLFDALVLTPRGRCLIDDQPGFLYPDVTETACRAAPGVTWVEGFATGAFWQPVTSAFSHTEVWHIGFNMLALWFLGPQLEALLGRVRFVALYALSALGGSAAVLWLAEPYGATLGASGAVFGLLGGLLLAAYKVGGQYQQILIWLGINVVITVLGSSFISWQGHLGGLVTGLLVAGVVLYAPRERRGLWQALGLGAIALVVLALTLARALLL